MAQFKNPHTLFFSPNPRLKLAEIAVTFRDAKGRFCAPARAASATLLLPGKRKAQTIEFPKEYRRTIALRRQYLAKLLVEHSRKQAEKRQTKEGKLRERKRLKASLARVRAKPVSPAEAKKRKTLKTRMQVVVEEVREEMVRSRGRERRFYAPELLDRKVSVKSVEEKFVFRSDPRKNVPKHADSREGIQDFMGKSLVLEKLHVDFDPTKPVPVFPFNARAQSVVLREYFRPHAVKFLDRMRGESENAYILRVKTQTNLSTGQKTQDGVGTERFRVRNHIPGDQLRHLKREYPGLTRDQILRELQLEDLADRLQDLFNYFLERYEEYQARALVDSIAVSGFTMEVVKGVV